MKLHSASSEGSCLDTAIQQAQALQQQGNLTAAEGILRPYMSELCSSFQLAQTCGVIALELGDAVGAVKALRVATTLCPDVAVAWCQLGQALVLCADLPRAEASLRTALTLAPGDMAAARSLLQLLYSRKDIEAVDDLLMQLVESYSEDISIWRLLGDLRREAGNLPGAIEAYRQVLVRQPRAFEVLNDLGTIFLDLGHIEQALHAFQSAHEQGCEHPKIYINMGNAHAQLGEHLAAYTAYHRALERGADTPAMFISTANSLRALGRIAEAQKHLERAVQAHPSSSEALAALIHQQQHVADWQLLDERLAELQRLTAAEDLDGRIPPFTTLAQLATAKEQRRMAVAYASRRFAPFAAMRGALRRPSYRKPGPRRVGYISPDFKQHPVAELMVEVLELHDRSLVEVWGFALSPDDGSQLRQRIVAACDQFIDVASCSILETAQCIADAGIDMLVHLAGYTEGARTEVLALRPAPYQINYLGYPGTMGAEFIDFLIADDIVIPVAELEQYTERVHYLSGCYQPNDRQRPVAALTPSRASCDLPENAFVLCCFNSTYKITPQIFKRWVRILLQVPHAVLWLLDGGTMPTANLRREAQAHGIEPERLIFASHLPAAEHRARYRIADLFLDTLPYNAHTTASEALWCGLPVLTCRGESFASRVASSLLQSIGLPELITDNLHAYEERAVRLALSDGELAHLRRRLHRLLLDARLFDTARHVRELERFYAALPIVHGQEVEQDDAPTGSIARDSL